MRNRNYDVIRVTATLMVICIHSMRPLRESIISGALALDNWICAIYYAIIGAGVPMFFMLSGALLIGKDDAPLMFYKKRLRRILVPFTIWSVIVYLLNWISAGASGEHMFSNFFESFISLSGVNEAYWFVYVLLFLYIVTPFLAFIRRRSHHPIAWITILLTLYVLLRIGAWYYSVLFQPARWTGFLICYVAGYVLRSVKGRKVLMWSVPIVVVSMTLQVFYQVLDWMYLPLELISAMALFVSLNSLPEREKLAGEDIIDFIGRTSYGIYLSHVIVCGVLIRLSVYLTCIPVVCLPLLVVTIVITVEDLMMKSFERFHLEGYLY